MNPAKTTSTSFDYDQHARSCSPDDFWGQVKRTVRGQPVNEEQIGMIINAVRTHVDLNHNDILLDLACGNGALTRLLFNDCAGCVGVDLSEYLIAVAKENFEALPDYAFIHQDAGTYVNEATNAEQFTKVMCYGAFQCFPPEVAKQVLSTLYRKFVNVEKVFIGNLPDKDLADAFFIEYPPAEGLLDDFASPLGMWRTKEEFAALANAAGWKISFLRMPKEFYGAHYRYDVVLTRQ